jgi:hypothetical protein
VVTASEPGWIGLFSGLGERRFRKLVGDDLTEDPGIRQVRAAQ